MKATFALLADVAVANFVRKLAWEIHQIEVYRQVYDDISERAVNLSFTADTLAMFVYDEPLSLNGEYMTYKILPIGE